MAATVKVIQNVLQKHANPKIANWMLKIIQRLKEEKKAMKLSKEITMLEEILIGSRTKRKENLISIIKWLY